MVAAKLKRDGRLTDSWQQGMSAFLSHHRQGLETYHVKLALHLYLFDASCQFVDDGLTSYQLRVAHQSRTEIESHLVVSQGHGLIAIVDSVFLAERRQHMVVVYRHVVEIWRQVGKQHRHRAPVAWYGGAVGLSLILVMLNTMKGEPVVLFAHKGTLTVRDVVHRRHGHQRGVALMYLIEMLGVDIRGKAFEFVYIIV